MLVINRQLSWWKNIIPVDEETFRSSVSRSIILVHLLFLRDDINSSPSCQPCATIFTRAKKEVLLTAWYPSSYRASGTISTDNKKNAINTRINTRPSPLVFLCPPYWHEYSYVVPCLCQLIFFFHKVRRTNSTQPILPPIHASAQSARLSVYQVECESGSGFCLCMIVHTAKLLGFVVCCPPKHASKNLTERIAYWWHGQK